MNNEATVRPGTAAAGISINVADYDNEGDAADLLALLDAYAADPMGGGAQLPEEVRHRVVAGLRATPGAFSMIARIDGEAVALANCFVAYSTFAAAPLVNVHDFVVASGHRGQGVGKALLAAIDVEGYKRGACKVTLEVLNGNSPAKALYAACGFGDYQLDPAAGHALFWQKKL